MVKELAFKVKNAAKEINNSSHEKRHNTLLAMAQALRENTDQILAANEIDLAKAKEAGVSNALYDRLRLTEERLGDMANAILQIHDLPDCIGEVLSMWKRPNDLLIGKKRVSLGVVAIIYEARPNVTADAAALCIKTGNAVILRGGKEAINSNKAIVDALQTAVANYFPKEIVSLVTDTSRESANELMKLNGLVDVLIPRGGTGLIRSVVENSTVPVIETGAGNCHVYIDVDADAGKALDIVVNAKTQRPGVCNAAETLLVDSRIAGTFLPLVKERLEERNVKILGCPETQKIIDVEAATEEDFGTEFLDLIISVRIVDGIIEAVNHISKYSTGHSEAIVTNDYNNAQYFLDKVDSAAVFVNASTRFTDGGEFGFGAEIGISTQKLHARGPMGLEALTTIKYIIYGNGQVR
jgi:glutamate-5-semialdehyde dehydrogenase